MPMKGVGGIWRAFTSIVAPLAITGNLLAQILESGTSRGNDCPLCLDQTSHSSNDPSFHLQVKVFLCVQVLSVDILFLVFGFWWHLSCNVDHRSKDALHSSANATDDRLQHKALVSNKCQILIYDPQSATWINS